MKIEDFCLGIEKLDWRSINDLQPENFKQDKFDNVLYDSLKKKGFRQVFHCWRDSDGVIYFIDGHTRKKVLQKLFDEGIDVPEKLSCAMYRCESKKDAIKILIECFNGKTNTIDKKKLMSFLSVNEIDDVKIENIEAKLLQFPVDFAFNEDDSNIVEDISNLRTSTLVPVVINLEKSVSAKLESICKQEKIKNSELISKIIKNYDSSFLG